MSAVDTVDMAFDHVGISVRDLDEATRWWCDALGLRPEYSLAPPGTDLTGVVLIHPTGFRIELLHRPGSQPGPTPPGPTEAAAAAVRG